MNKSEFHFLFLFIFSEAFPNNPTHRACTHVIHNHHHGSRAWKVGVGSFKIPQIPPPFVGTGPEANNIHKRFHGVFVGYFFIIIGEEDSLIPLNNVFE